MGKIQTPLPVSLKVPQGEHGGPSLVEMANGAIQQSLTQRNKTPGKAEQQLSEAEVKDMQNMALAAAKFGAFVGTGAMSKLPAAYTAPGLANAGPDLGNSGRTT